MTPKQLATQLADDLQRVRDTANTQLDTGVPPQRVAAWVSRQLEHLTYDWYVRSHPQGGFQEGLDHARRSRSK